MITARLLHKVLQKTFCIGTYHMPCAFWMPEVMIIHTALATQHLQRFARGQEHIFAGDFNFTPDSHAYGLMTKNHSPPIPVNHDDDEWVPQLSTVMKSAYASLDQEPEVTNFAKTSHVFAGVLDYIFISPGLTCKSVLALPSLDELRKGCESLPNAKEPSDHLLIGASITFKALEQETKSLHII
jgi:mRNA deadenylase 3'-5' endonuclease subunit Ccr4